MTVHYSHIPRPGPEAIGLSCTVLGLIASGTANPVVVSTLQEHAESAAQTLIHTTAALSAAEGAARVARDTNEVSEDDADDALREGFTVGILRGGAGTKNTLEAVSGGRTYGEVVALTGARQVEVVLDIAAQAAVAPDRFGLSEAHLNKIVSTNNTLAVTTAALDDAVRATAAARLARRQAEDAFIAAMRVVVRILVALLGRETLATLLPRFERVRAA